MGSTVVVVLGKVLMSMAMKLVAAEAIEEMLIWLAKKLAAHTDSKADDELVALIEKHLNKPGV